MPIENLSDSPEPTANAGDRPTVWIATYDPSRTYAELRTMRNAQRYAVRTWVTAEIGRVLTAHLGRDDSPEREALRTDLIARVTAALGSL